MKNKSLLKKCSTLIFSFVMILFGIIFVMPKQTKTAFASGGDYTIIFDLNGGKYNNTTTAPSSLTGQTDGTDISLESTGLSKDGYVFVGWNTNSNAINGSTSYTVNSADDTDSDNSITLYAIWVEVHTHAGMTFDNVLTSEFTGDMLSGGNYFLNEDISLINNITISYLDSVNICLNGHVINVGAKSILAYGTLNIYDCQHDSENIEHKFSVNSSGLWILDNSGDKTVKGGVITGGINSNAINGGVNSIVNIYSLNFIGNQGESGAAIYSNGKINIYNSRFYGNIAEESGGAIFAGANLLIKGSEIKYNKATNGGGVYIGDCYTTIINSTISNNIATGNGGGINITPGSCLIQGTKVTMADGSVKNIEDIVEGDYVKTFDHETGLLTNKKVYYTYASTHKASALMLHFTNGFEVGICGTHALFEQSAKKYVLINETNYSSFIGKYFYNATDGRWEKLLSVTVSTKKYNYYSLYIATNFNCIANGMLTAPDDSIHMLNIFEFEDDLTINQVQKQADIDRFGLVEFEDCRYLTREQYDDYNYQYAKIAVGKDLISYEKLFGFYDEMTGTKVNLALYFETINCDTYYDDYEESTLLILGDNVVIYGNTNGSNQASNVYINGETYIKVLENATGINVGINVNDLDNPEFATEIYTNNLTISSTDKTPSFKSDNSKYGIKTVADDNPGTYIYSLTKYYFKYDANGMTDYLGTLPSNENGYLIGDTFEISQNAISKEGYTFVGWSINPKATSAMTSYIVSDADDENFDSVIKIYAIWAIVESENSEPTVWILILSCVIGAIAILVALLLLLKKKITFAVNDKKLSSKKLKFNEKIMLDGELRKYDWFMDKEMTKPLERDKMGLFNLFVYGKAKKCYMNNKKPIKKIEK